MTAQQIIDALTEQKFKPEELLLIYTKALALMSGLPADTRHSPTMTRPAKSMYEFKVGEEVILSQQCGTAYLRGKAAVIVRFGRTRVKLKLIIPEGRFQGVFSAPTDLLLKKVPAGE